MIERKEKLVEAVNEELEAASEQIRTLQKQSIQVHIQEKIVEKIPDGFTSTNEAIKAAKQKLDDLLQQQDELKQTNALLSQEKEELSQLEAAIHHVLEKYSIARLASITEHDPQIKQILQGTGELFIQLGQQLRMAVSA
jgi:DNA repair exonuclease SbcCD ATPase subunit